MKGGRGLLLLLALAMGFAWVGEQDTRPTGGSVDPLLASLDAMDAAKGREALVALREQLADDPASPRAGNPEGRIPVVVFFDYRCVYCRQLPPMLERLAAENPDVRLVFKEWPIFRGISEVAARTALAADRQGAYWLMHQALMAERPLTETSILATAERLGLDRQRLLSDRDDPSIAAQLRDTAELADALHLKGTPVIVVGDRVLRGLPGENELREAVRAAAS
ncbi:MAG: DsbA family protein [Geminicoccaceae bacterium]